MTKTVGTLREIGARVGDVVVVCDEPSSTFTLLEDFCLLVKYECGYEQILDRGWFWDNCDDFRIIRRATKPFNTLTAEEKGELLLANHEGKIIEMSLDGVNWDRSYTPQWIGAACYRVKDDEVSEYTLHGCVGKAWGEVGLAGDTHRITFNLVNGKPDCASVKMDEIK